MTITVTGVAGSLALTEADLQASPALLFPDAVLTTLYSLNHGRIQLGGLAVGDVLGITATGSGSTAIALNGSTISYGGTDLGQFDAASDVITLHNNSTVAGVEALLHSLTLTVGDAPAATRTVTLDLSTPDLQHINQTLSFSPFAAPRFAGFDVGFRSSLAVGQLTPNPKLDLIVGAADGSVGLLQDVEGRVLDGTPSTVDRALYMVTPDGNLTPIVTASGAAAPTSFLQLGKYPSFIVGAADGTVHAYADVFVNTYVDLNNAQSFPAISTNVFSSFVTDIDVGTLAAPTLFDVDADGRLDLVIGNGDGKLLAYRNNGADTPFTLFDYDFFGGIDVGDAARPTFVDLDGDGRLDLVVGSAAGDFHAWRNAIDVFVEFASNPFAGISAGALSSPAFVDLDGDGKLDLVSGSGDGTLLAWRNTSSWGVTTTVTVAPQNDPPVITSGGAPDFAENGTGVAYQATAQDPDSATLFWSLGGADQALFSISDTGAVRFRVAPDYETPQDQHGQNVYHLTVIAGDSGGLFAQKPVTVNVTNANDVPTGSVNLGFAGRALHASHTLADQDGLGAVTFRWERYDSSGDEWTAITGNGDSLVVDGYQGGALRSFARYTDGLSNVTEVGSGVVLVGSDGNDSRVGDGPPEVLLGLAGNDTLVSGGQDTLYGGGGHDVAQFAVARAAATLTQRADDGWDVTTAAGTTSLHGVEVARFTDGDETLGIDPQRDIMGNGADALLWRADDGVLWRMDMAGGAVVGGAGYMVAPPWTVLGTGDFDGDGRSDVLWRHTDGTLYLWQMVDGHIASQGMVGQVEPSWHLAGIADFDGNGRAETLWQRDGDGAMWLSSLDGGAILGGVGIGGPGGPWSLASVPDLDGDGRADLLWQNATTGGLYAWLMNGGQILGQADLGPETALGYADWAVAGTGDFNGDGRADVVLRSAGTGALRLWQMGPGLSHESLAVADAGASWQVAAIGDFNADAKADILWRQPGTGYHYVWLMRGAGIVGGTDIGTPGSEWHALA